MTPKRVRVPRQRNTSSSVCSSSLSSKECNSSESPSKAAAADALYSKGSGIGKFRFSRHPNIFKMIEAEDWSQVRNYIQTDQGKRTCKKSDTSGLSVLGMALGYHSPIDIVVKLLDIDPKSSLKYDMFQAVPLHVACLNGADLEVVNYLLDHDDNASAHCADSDKRVALHHAVEYACQEQEEGENDGIDVIKSLSAAAPTMLQNSDIHGDTPIDMCQMVKYEIEVEDLPSYQKAETVYQILREANIRRYRKEKKHWERDRIIVTKSKNSLGSKDDTASTALSTIGAGLSLMEDLTLSESADKNSTTQENRRKRKKKTFLGSLFSRKSRRKDL